VLGDWQPRPDAIVHVESLRHGTLTRDLAEGLSRYLQVPLLGSFAIADPDVPPGAGSSNSAHRVAAVRRRHRLLCEPGSLDGRRVLLVDDQVVSGWTLTLAAYDLREAGASAVLPLTLAVQA
jgi:ATP-dependent DNA helicase RecQ